VAEYRPAEESFTDLVERELDIPALNTPLIKTVSPNPMIDTFKVSSPRVNPAQAAATRAASHDPASGRVVPDPNSATIPKRADDRRQGVPSTAMPQIKKDPEKIGGNGPFDFAYFQSLMDEYLEANQFQVVKKTTTGSKVLKGAIAFSAMVLSFLLAIYIAMQLGIIN